MSFVVSGPEAMAAAATNLAGIGWTITEANVVAAVQTTGLQAAAADQMSAAVAALFGAHAQGYQSIGAQMSAFHDQSCRLCPPVAAPMPPMPSTACST
jgi:hypothetical protein